MYVWSLCTGGKSNVCGGNGACEKDEGGEEGEEKGKTNLFGAKNERRMRRREGREDK